MLLRTPVVTKLIPISYFNRMHGYVWNALQCKILLLEKGSLKKSGIFSTLGVPQFLTLFPLSKINMKTCSESCKNAKNFFCALWPPPPSSLDWDLWLSIHQEKRLSLEWIPWEEVDTTRWTMDPTQRTSMGSLTVLAGWVVHSRASRSFKPRRLTSSSKVWGRSRKAFKLTMTMRCSRIMVRGRRMKNQGKGDGRSWPCPICQLLKTPFFS